MVQSIMVSFEGKIIIRQTLVHPDLVLNVIIF